MIYELVTFIVGSMFLVVAYQMGKIAGQEQCKELMRRRRVASRMQDVRER